jgi:lipopolysaccharide biosynthesis protein
LSILHETDVILKVHAKPFLHPNPERKAHAKETIDFWTNTKNIGKAQEILANRPDVGIVGRVDDVVSKFAHDPHSNSGFFKLLESYLGPVSVEKPQADRHGTLHTTFLAGSMYMARVSALRLLVDLPLRAFAEPLPVRDGQIEHAIERLLLLSARSHGHGIMAV